VVTGVCITIIRENRQAKEQEDTLGDDFLAVIVDAPDHPEDIQLPEISFPSTPLPMPPRAYFPMTLATRHQGATRTHTHAPALSPQLMPPIEPPTAHSTAPSDIEEQPCSPPHTPRDSPTDIFYRKSGSIDLNENTSWLIRHGFDPQVLVDIAAIRSKNNQGWTLFPYNLCFLYFDQILIRLSFVQIVTYILAAKTFNVALTLSYGNGLRKDDKLAMHCISHVLVNKKWYWYSSAGRCKLYVRK
jgi:hypothetical protein